MEGRQVLLFVGRLIDIKNLFFLLDALALVVNRYPKVILLFVGDGDQRVALERHAERNGLADHVIFAGKSKVRIYMLVIMSARYLCCQVIMSVLERW